MEPYLRGETASTTSLGGNAKISAAAARRRASLPKADRLPSSRTMGAKTPVSMTVTYRGGAEPWYEVTYAMGTVYVIGTDSLHSLTQKLIAGGHKVRPVRRQRRGTSKRAREWQGD